MPPRGVDGSRGVAGSHTSRSTGTKAGNTTIKSGGVPRPGPTVATKTKGGDGQSVNVPSTRVNPPVSSKKVIGQKGRTVAGTNRTIKS